MAEVEHESSSSDVSPATPEGEVATSRVLGFFVQSQPRWRLLRMPDAGVVHSVTDTELKLIHPVPFQTSTIAAQIESCSGDIFRVMLMAEDCTQRGELFEFGALCSQFTSGTA
jgi:hypothetical protein